MAVGEGLQAQGAVGHLGRRRAVVVAGAGARVGQQARVEGAADDHRRTAFLGGREQFGERALVEEGVAPGAQHRVDVGVPDEAGEHPGLVHARADRADDAFRAQPFQGRVALAEGLFGVVVGVVQVDEVDAVDAEPGEAGLQGAPDAVGGEVPDAAVGGGDGEAVSEVVAGVVAVDGFEAAADLGGEGVLGARAGAQGLAEAAFGEAEAVVRGGVEVPHALPPGGGDGLVRLCVVERGVEVADAAGAEAEGGDRHAPAVERVPSLVLARVHRFTGRGLRPCIPPSTARAVPVVAPESGLAR